MKVTALVFWFVSMLFSFVLADEEGTIATTRVIYRVHPLYASKVFEKWLSDNNWDSKEHDGLTPRVNPSGLVSALGVIVRRGESVSVSFMDGEGVLVAKLTPENHVFFKKGYSSLMKAEVRVIPKKEFLRTQKKTKSEEYSVNEDPFAEPVKE